MRNEAHLNFIRSLPCCTCLDNISTEAAHVRMADARYEKAETGMGRKPADQWTVPLCARDHTLQHSMGERKFWGMAEIDPLRLAVELFKVTGDHAAGERIIREAQR